MARIPDSFIQDLLNRVDIVDVVERYLPLKKAGQNYQACCPFHKEKSPSFTVSPAKQFYHCFGCGAHGSAVSFVMEYQAISFPDAVRSLAESVGMQMPVEEGDARPEDKTAPSLFDALKQACDFYRAQLKNAPEAITYLKGRGVAGQIAARFGLGYAPGGDDWQALKKVFPDYDWNAQLIEAGLVIEKEETKRKYDRFRDRVMFPIINQRNQVIGFGGRVMGKGEPKYLNSPETPVFEKGRELYGLPQARAAIRDKGRVLVVEGYMDVVMLHQHGVEYAVATLGTACTPEHVKKLLKLADEVVFCFDGDAAGRRAAWRGLENSLPVVTDGKELRFLFLPTEHDPDSYVQEFGRERFENVLSREALPLSQYLLKELSAQVDLSSEEGRARLLHIAKPHLAQMTQAPVLQILIRKRLGELCQLTLEDMASLQPQTQSDPAGDWDEVPERRERGDFRREGRGNWQGERRWSGRGERNAPPRGAGGKRNPPPGVLQRLLRLALFSPSLLADCEPFWLGWLPDGLAGTVAEVLSAAREQPDASGMTLLEAWRERPEFPMLSESFRDANSLLAGSPQEMLVQEFADTCAAAGRALALPGTQERYRELVFRASNGGLTEEEKSEYLALLVKK